MTKQIYKSQTGVGWFYAFIIFAEDRMRLSITQASLVLHSAFTIFAEDKIKPVRMKALFNSFTFLLILLLVGLASCDSDSDELTAEEIAYIELNEAYIEEKAIEKDADGNLVYQQIEYAGYTVLYRVLEKEGDDTSTIEADSQVTMQLKGDYITGQTFQQEMEMSYRPDQLIVGIALVLLEAHKGETIEAIIPAALGYGYNDSNGIAKGSTLIFTVTILDVN